MGLALIVCLSFVLSALATRLAIPLLARFGAVADENERTMHFGRVPQGGGAPLLIAAFAVALGMGVVNPAVVAATAALAALSLANDRSPVPATLRLLIHLAVAGAYLATLDPTALVFQGLLPFWLDRLAAALALTWMMNLFNFMDGINGIAGAEAVAIAAGYLLIATLTGGTLEHAAIACAIAGASAGFLVWNLRPRALVFMGDVGSVPLGFLTGALMLDLAIRGFWAAALIIPSYFLADATLTLLARLQRGEKIWEPHRSHFYQRAAQGAGSHLAIVARIALANAALIALAAWSIASPWIALFTAAVVVIALLFELGRCASAKSRSLGSDP